MDTKFEQGDPFDLTAGAIIVPVFSQDDGFGAVVPLNSAAQDFFGRIVSLARAADFNGKMGTSWSCPTLGALPAERVILAGIGSEVSLSLESIRQAWGAAAGSAKRQGVQTIASPLPPRSEATETRSAVAAAVEGATLALYSFRDYYGAIKNATPYREMDALTFAGREASGAEVDDGIGSGSAMAAAVALARDLSNEPANVLTPARFADVAAGVAAEAGLEITVFGPEELAELGADAILTVGKGSANEPRMIHLVYRPEEATEETKAIGLVGKCITFDTGGYSLKSKDGIVGMKGDMAGAAAVLGAMSALRAVESPHVVHAVICAAENMISDRAFRPEDVIVGMNGVTMEIISTDAEGRLVLADGLVFTARQGVAEMIDLATLTGGKVTALGSETTGLFANDDALAERILGSAERAGESMWRLPLSAHLEKQIKGSTADIKNSGGAAGSAITAALFLQHFCEGLPWAHLDIAGGNRTTTARPYTPVGATGVGVQTLLDYLTAE